MITSIRCGIDAEDVVPRSALVWRVTLVPPAQYHEVYASSA